MGREHLRTPDEFMAVEFDRVMALFGQALPTEADRTSFERHVNEANTRGMNWVQALEYAAAQRGERSRAQNVEASCRRLGTAPIEGRAVRPFLRRGVEQAVAVGG